MPTFSEPRIVCRPSLPADTQDVLRFTRNIWEGRDYIHLVWDEWLADSTGILVSAQFGPRVVGIAKVTPAFPGQWWLHGLRVDPEFQGLKIASHLHEYTNDWWLQYGDGAIRLLTSTKRVQVHHLCERTGYRRVGEVITYRLRLDAAHVSIASGPEAQGEFQGVQRSELPEALAFARQNLAHVDGLMDTGWRFVAPDEASVADRQAEGGLHWWRGRRGLMATWDGDDDDGHVLGIGFAATREPGQLSAMLRDSAQLANGMHAYAMFWLAPREPEIEEALRAAGFRTDEDAGVLYERRHP